MTRSDDAKSILHVLKFATPAGIENQVYRYLQTAQEHNHHLLLMEGTIHEKFRDFIEENLPYRFYKRVPNFPFLKTPRFMRPFFLNPWLRGKDFDASLLYNELHRHRLIRCLQENVAGQTIYYDQGSSWSQPDEEHELAQSFDRIVSISRASRIMMSQKLGVDTDKITLIPNSIPGEEFDDIQSHSPSDYDEVVPPRDDTFDLLFLGRLETQKGTNSLIRMCQHLDDTYRLLIVGDGKEKPKLEALSRDLGVEDQILFLGYQPDPRDFLSEADAMLVPSVYEPLGIVVLEAGAAELPVIASRIDGIPDVITDGEDGLLIEPTVESQRFIDDLVDQNLPVTVVNPLEEKLTEPKFLDPETLADKARWLRNNPDKRSELAANLNKKVENQYTTADTHKQLNQLFEE